MGMVMVVEQASFSLQQPVETPGQPHAESLHAARERIAALGLDHQVQVRAEHGELDQPRPAQAPRSGKACPDRGEPVRAP